MATRCTRPVWVLRPSLEVMDPRRLLDEERAETLERLQSLREDYSGVVDASRDTNADDEHDPEGQTIAFERSQTGALVRQAEQHLREVDAARRRWEAGTYGVCEVCGALLPPGRLEARPTARTCVACASSGAAAGTRRR
jgi:DnaK suppressor protein